MANYKADGIILKARDFGESDRILTIFDRNLGKLEAVAKGARRVKSTLRGPCQVFSHNIFLLWQGRSLDGVSQCEVVDIFASLRDNLVKLAAASYVAELADDIVREKDPEPEIFDLTLATLHWLDELEPTPANISHALRAFDLRLLSLAGFGPSLDACAICGLPVEEWAAGPEGAPRPMEAEGRGGGRPQAGGGPASVAFSASAGGIVCPACLAAAEEEYEEQVARARAAGGAVGAGGPPGVGPTGGGNFGTAGASLLEPVPPDAAISVRLALGTLQAMRHLAQASPERARVLRLTPRAAKEMEVALRQHIVYHLDKRLKSVDFLDTVLGWSHRGYGRDGAAAEVGGELDGGGRKGGD